MEYKEEFDKIWNALPPKEKREEKRIIPLDKEFMCDKKTHDKVYAYLQLNSYLTKDKKRFVYYTKETEVKSIHSAIVRKVISENGKEKDDISLATVRNTIKLYKQIGLIYDDIITDLYGNNVKVMILSQNFTYFSLIPYDTLKFLVDTSNENVIKVYAYLLNKFQYKQKEKQQYIFNLKELCAAVGYSAKSENTTTMRNILKSLQNNNLIKYNESYFVDDGKPPIPIFILIAANIHIK